MKTRNIIYKLVWTLISSIFVLEATLMFILHSYFPSINVITEMLVDSFLLIIMLSPVFYIIITKQKKADAELQKFKLCIEQSSEAIFITDINGTIEFVNSSFEKIYGYTPKEAINKTPGILKSDTYDEDTYKYFWDILLKKEMVAGELINKTKDGRLITVEGNNTSIIDSNGNIIGLIGVHRDITGRKKVEEEMRKGEERFRDLFDNANDLIQSVGTDGTFFYVNKAWHNALGYTEEDLATLNLFDIIHPKSMEHCQQAFKNLMENKKEIKLFEATFITKNGKSVDIEGSVSVALREGVPNATRAILRDITKRKEAEEKVKQMVRELNDRYNELMQFNYIVSHNLRAPISNIIGLANVMNMPNVSMEEKPKIMERIREATIKMEEMTKDLSMILTSRSAINTIKEKVTLTSIIHSITDSFEKQIMESSTIIKNDIADDANEIYTIKAYMESILNNLISNATTDALKLIIK